MTAVFSAGLMGGSERINVEVLEAAHACGVALHVVVPTDGPVVDELSPIADVVDIVPQPERLAALSRFDGKQLVRDGAVTTRALHRYLSALRAVVARTPGPLCCFGLRAQLAAGYATIGMGRPQCWIVHEIVPSGWMARIWRLVAARADSIFAMSSAAATQGPLTGLPVEVVQPEIPVDAFRSIASPAVPVRTLGLVGDLFELKNHLGAIEVTRRLRSRGFDLRLLLVGRDTSSFNDTDEYVRRLRGAVNAAAPWVLLESARPDEMPSVMRRIDVLLHLSTFPESLGRVCIEAMAAGRPVVAFELGAIPETLAGSGILCPPGSLETVEQAMVDLLSDPAAFESLSEKARATRPGMPGARGISAAVADFAARTTP